MVGIAITRRLAHTATFSSECRPPSAWMGSKCVSKASSTSSSINVCLLPACFRNAVAKVGGNSKSIWTICGTTVRLSVVQLSVMAPAQKLCRRPYLNTCLTISPDKAWNQVSVELQTAAVPWCQCDATGSSSASATASSGDSAAPSASRTERSSGERRSRKSALRRSWLVVSVNSRS